jgi:CHAT domain-containing protein
MNRRSRIAIVVGLCGTLTLSARRVAADVPPGGDAFSACRQQFSEKPHEYDSAYCFYQTAVQQQRWQEGAEVFETMVQEHPENCWLPLAYGHLYRERNPDRTEALYRRAADGFRKEGNAAGEIVSRSNLRNFLFHKGRPEDATVELERVSSLEASVDDPLLKAQIWTLQALHVQETGGDLGLAYRLLKGAQRATFPAGPYRLKRHTLSSLAIVAFRMGRLDEALAMYNTLEGLAAAERDPREQAAARYSILNVSSTKEGLHPTPGSRQRLMALAERSLEAGLSARHALVTLKTHRMMASLLAADTSSRAAALGHVKECLTLSVTTRQPHDEAVCSWLEASLHREKSPRKAHAAASRALAAAARANSPVTEAYSAGRHMRLSWETKTRPEAIRDSLAAIEAIETLRSLQDDGDSSAELFSSWTLDYYWFSGRLLRDRRESDVDLAFSVTERLRARSLLDRVARVRSRLDPAHPALAKRRSLLTAIAAVQRRLMNPSTSDRERHAALDELEELEEREQEAQRQIALASDDREGATPAFANLDAVQAALAGNEALLSFQVGIWENYEGAFAGGSWLIAVTRQGRTVHPLPDRGGLAPMMPVFTGLLARGDEVGTAAAVRLYDDLLADALQALPPGIERLILLPDGPLHRLSFDALRAGRDEDPLAARYELVIAPSATLWLRGRRSTARTTSRGALAFADPELDVADDREATERTAVLQRGLRLGRLPHARHENRALERYVGGVDALAGEHASERALKARDLRAYTLLHFAAHAIADESHPDRSAVLLSPGAGDEDGLLQAREIEGLDLEGRVVVLSACQTASGAVLGGEGVLSLARAFFAGGARSVIGTRWPIRDEDAAALFDTFYRALGRGATVSEALMTAKIDAIDAGRPASAWAGLVLLGDGGMRPFPDGPLHTSRSPGPAAALALGVVLLLTFPVRRAARKRRPPSAA